MNFYKLLLISILFSTSAFATDFVKGTLERDGDHFFILAGSTKYLINTSTKIKSSLPSLDAPTYVVQSNGKKYVFEFKGQINNTYFDLEQTPTLLPGDTAETGILNYGPNEGQYSINGIQSEFGYTKVLNGYSFDEKSKQSLVGKNVLAEGYIDQSGLFIMQAITPANLFTASKADGAPDHLHEKIVKRGARKFIFNEMNKNENSQSEISFRTTFFEKKNNPVVPGDDFLVITLSGRQGDTFGSVNGHMVAGIGEVKDDLTLRGEVSNAYVTNGKDILSGNTSLTNYFSHTVQGQNNYRPTYTLIAYGIDKSKLQQFRDALEESHVKFRTEKLDITPQFNCTTETIKALKNVGITGKYRRIDNWITAIFSSPAYLFGESGRTLHYSLRNDPSTFQPRPAYNSFVKTFLSKGLRKKLGIKRVDFIYYSQIPSSRPVGGMALGTIFGALKWKKMYDKYEVNESTKLGPVELRPLLKEKLQSIE